MNGTVGGSANLPKLPFGPCGNVLRVVPRVSVVSLIGTDTCRLHWKSGGRRGRTGFAGYVHRVESRDQRAIGSSNQRSWVGNVESGGLVVLPRGGCQRGLRALPHVLPIDRHNRQELHLDAAGDVAMAHTIGTRHCGWVADGAAGSFTPSCVARRKLCCAAVMRSARTRRHGGAGRRRRRRGLPRDRSGRRVRQFWPSR